MKLAIPILNHRTAFLPNSTARHSSVAKVTRTMVKIRRNIRSKSKIPPSFARRVSFYICLLIGGFLFLQGAGFYFGQVAERSRINGSNSVMGVAEQLKTYVDPRPSNKKLPINSAKPPPSNNKIAADLDRKGNDSSSQKNVEKLDLKDLEEPNIHMHYPGNLNNEKVAYGDAGSPNHQLVVGKVGTGPTNVAYVRDFASERDDPAFRHFEIQSNGIFSKVTDAMPDLQLTPCTTVKDKTRQFWSDCLNNESHQQVVYNSADFPRTWCGQEISPKSAVLMNSHCTDRTVHLFSKQIPPFTGQDMPPIIIKSHRDSIDINNDVQPLEGCNIPCSVMKDIKGEERYIDGESWEVIQTFANPSYQAQARIDKTDFRRDRYYSTQSFKSSVPLSHFSFEHHTFRSAPAAVDFDTALDKAAYIADILCVSPLTKRKQFVEEVEKVYSVDSFGVCNHNKDVPEGMDITTPEGRIELLKQYRFVLAFDSSKDPDYISPLMWEAFSSGAVPIVVGADNFRDHVPKNSYIDADAIGKDNIGAEIKRISQSKEEWMKYQSWRSDEAAIAKAEAKYEFTKIDPTCRLCRWAYSQKYGLGWDHVKQEVEETRIPRKLCIASESGLASQPFDEEWIGRYDDDNLLQRDPNDAVSCDATTATATIDNDSFKIQRTIVEHDGFTDIFITDIDRHNTDGEVVLRLLFPNLHNLDGAHFANSHMTVPDMTYGPIVSSASIQDNFSKVTVLADWVTTITSPVLGSLEIIIQEPEDGPLEPNSSKRLRVIVEDMQVLHDRMTEFFPSPFCKKVIKDFVDPLEVFIAVAP